MPFVNVARDCSRNGGWNGDFVWSNDPSFQFGFKQAGYAMDSWFHTPGDSDFPFLCFNFRAIAATIVTMMTNIMVQPCLLMMKYRKKRQ